MISTARDALRLVDAWTRRKVVQAVIAAVGLALLETLAFGLLYALLAATAPSSQGQTSGFVGRLLHLDNVSTGLLGLSCVVLLLTKSVTAAFVARWQVSVQTRTEMRLATRVFGEYLETPLLFHVERNSAYSISILTAHIGTLSSGVIGGLITVITESLVLASIFAALLAVSPLLACVIAVYVAIVASFYVVVISRYTTTVSIRFYELYQSMMQAMHEGLGGIKGIQAFGVTREVAARYAAIRVDYADASARMAFALRLPQFYLEVCAVTAIAVAGVIISLASSSGQQYAVVGLLIVAALRVMPSGNRLLGALSGIRLGEAAVAPLRDERVTAPVVTDLKSEIRQALPDGSSLPRMRHRIVLKGLTFAYPGTRVAALDHIGLSISRGESVGIVGQSGSGKTTLVDVLLGLLTPQSGSFEVDDTPITAGNLMDWRRQVAYVPQETFLMDGSVADNVAFYRSVPGDQTSEVWRALEEAMLADFVRELPDGLESMVGERGARLSGGQKQRLGIARALLTRPEILVLDEATSALDGSTEAAITETLQALKGHVTTITIAHRLSTVRTCDRLILMHGGRVVDEGTFDELRYRSSSFAEMAIQAGL